MILALMLHLIAFAPPSAPAFVVDTIADGERTGIIDRIDAAGAVHFRDPIATIPAADLLSIQQHKMTRPSYPVSSGVILANGDRIGGDIIGGDETAVRLRATAELRVPFGFVQVIWYTPIPGDLSAFPDRYPWLPAERKKDYVLLRNGDVQIGDIERLGDGGSLKLLVNGKSIDFEASRIAAVALNPSLMVARKPKGRTARLVTANGSRYTLTAITADATTLRGTTVFGAKIEIPLGDVIALDGMNPKAIDLTELKPLSEKLQPFGEVTWPWATNRSAKDRPLRLKTANGISTFDRGFGTHPNAVRTYALDGKFRRFDATTGLDPITGPRGSAVVRILVDNEVRELKTVSPNAVHVHVDIAKAKRLTLEVEFGPGGDVHADVNWANPRLVE